MSGAREHLCCVASQSTVKVSVTNETLVSLGCIGSNDGGATGGRHRVLLARVGHNVLKYLSMSSYLLIRHSFGVLNLLFIVVLILL